MHSIPIGDNYKYIINYHYMVTIRESSLTVRNYCLLESDMKNADGHWTDASFHILNQSLKTRTQDVLILHDENPQVGGFGSVCSVMRQGRNIITPKLMTFVITKYEPEAGRYGKTFIPYVEGEVIG